MKFSTKSMLFAFVAILSVINCSSQSRSTLTFDFQKKQWDHKTIPKKPKRGDLYQVKVKHVNQNLYSIHINSKDSTVSGVQEFPSFQMMSVDGLTAVISGLSSFTTNSPVSTSSKAAISKIIENKLDLELFSQKVMEKTSKEKGQMDSVSKRRSEIEDSVNVHYIDSIDRVINGLYSDLSKDLEILSDTQKVELNMFDKSMIMTTNLIQLKDCNMEIEELNYRASLLCISHLVDNQGSDEYKLLKNDFSFEGVILMIELIRHKIKKFSEVINANQYDYTKFYEENKEIIEAKASLKENSKKLYEAFSKGLAAVDTLMKNINADRVKVVLEELLHFHNTAKMVYNSMEMQVNGDITSIELRIEPRDEKYRLQKYSTTYHFPLIKSYSGIGISLYYSPFKEREISTKAVAVDTVIKYDLVDEERKAGEVGIAALLHFGGKFKCTDYWGGHFTIGPAVALGSKIKPRFAVGGGLSYGKKQMITLNVLGVIGYVDKISKVYSLSERYETKPTNITVSRLDGTIGLSIGYIYKF